LIALSLITVIKYVGFWERLNAGNIDDEGSEAYRRWNPKAKAAQEAKDMDRDAATMSKEDADAAKVDPVAPEGSISEPVDEAATPGGFERAFKEFAAGESDLAVQSKPSEATQTAAAPKVRATAKPAPASPPISASKPATAAVLNGAPKGVNSISESDAPRSFEGVKGKETQIAVGKTKASRGKPSKPVTETVRAGYQGPRQETFAEREKRLGGGFSYAEAKAAYDKANPVIKPRGVK